MFVLNNTIDDSEPVIVYDPPDMWYQGDNTTDPGSSYWMGTKTWTTTLRATATFRFNGTGVTIIGAKRSNHGAYTVRLDGDTYNFTGFADSPEFQAVLFNASDLTQGIHDVVITNMEGIFLDIDCIRWVSSVGNEGQKHAPEDVIVQDADRAFTYGPSGAWNMKPEFVAHFNGSNGHSTSVPGAMVNYTFQGDAVSIYGTAGPSHSVYRVLLDDTDAGTFSANKLVFRPQVLLYHADNLGGGNHTITLINGETESLLEIDYALVLSEAPSSSKTVGGTLTLPSASSKPPTSNPVILPKGAIIAIILSIVFIIVVLALLIFLLNRRNKTLWQLVNKGYMVQSQFDSPMPPTPTLPMQFAPTSTSRREKSTRIVPRPDRSDTLQTDTTLVAEAGSVATETAGRLRPLKIVQNLGRKKPRSRSPSRTHLLGREETQRSESPVSEEHLGRPMYVRTVPHPVGPRLM